MHVYILYKHHQNNTILYNWMSTNTYRIAIVIKVETDIFTGTTASPIGEVRGGCSFGDK